MEASLKIAVVEENPIRAQVLLEGLCEAGHRDAIHIKHTKRLLQAI